MGKWIAIYLIVGMFVTGILIGRDVESAKKHADFGVVILAVLIWPLVAGSMLITEPRKSDCDPARATG